MRKIDHANKHIPPRVARQIGEAKLRIKRPHAVIERMRYNRETPNRG